MAASASNVYYLKDHLNTVNEITNAAGDIVQKMDYSAFGILRSVKDASGAEIGFENAPVRSSVTYTEREFEPELNMYYYRARYYDPSVGRFLQQDPEPGKTSLPTTVINKYIYAGNNPTMLSDPTGRDFLGDLWNFAGNVILYAIAITVTVLDLAIGYIGAALGLRKAPILHIESDGWTIENSFFADLFGSASWGPAIFLSSENEYGGDVWKHEYGHRLQFQDWGGWAYMGFMIERVSPSFSAVTADPTRPPSKEMDADKRATDYFGTPICKYPHITHPIPQCRYSN